MIAAIPADKLDFKLGEKGKTAAAIAWHIIRSEAWFASGIFNGEFGPDGEGDVPASLDEILKVYDETVPALTAKLADLSGEALSKPISFFGVFNYPAVMYLEFWKCHSVHHRGYLAAYLRAMNAHVPSIYGGSADEPFEMPATA